MAISAAAGSLIAAGLGAAGSAASTGISSGSGKKSQYRAYKYGEMQAQAAYERQRQFWDETFRKQNEYNLPENEVARLRAAGINVGAYYSDLANAAAPGGSTAAPQGSSGPAPVAATPGGGYFADIAQNLALREQESRIENTNAQTESIRKQSSLTEDHRDYLQSQTQVNEYLRDNLAARTAGEILSNNLAEQTMPLTIEQARQQCEINEALLDQYVDSLERSHLENQFFRDTYDDRRQLIKQDIQLKAAGVALDYAQMIALDAGIHLTEAQVNQIRVDIETELLINRPKGYKELNWYNADKVINHVKSVATGVVGAALGFKALKGRGGSATSPSSRGGSVNNTAKSGSLPLKQNYGLSRRAY